MALIEASMKREDREGLGLVTPPAIEFPAATIANAVVEVAAAMKALNSTRLSRNAVIVLIQAKSGLPRKHIELVLNNLEQLEETWLKPKKKDRH